MQKTWQVALNLQDNEKNVRGGAQVWGRRNLSPYGVCVGSNDKN